MYISATKIKAMFKNKFPENDNEAKEFLEHQYENDNGNIELLLAYCNDTLGYEKEAQPHYEKAMNLGFDNSELETWYVSYGSTLRWNGKFKQSLDILNKGSTLFPQSKDMPIMRAMTEYNLKLMDAQEVIKIVKKYNLRRLSWVKNSLKI